MSRHLEEELAARHTKADLRGYEPSAVAISGIQPLVAGLNPRKHP
jgi:hypothetical protein